MSSPGNEHDVKVEYVNMGPEQLSLCFMANDTQLVVAADLRDWIAAVGSEQALNKPRLVANANKYAKLLVSETGLGVETAHDLAMMDVRDLCDQKFPTADAKAIVGMLNGRAVEPGDDCRSSDVTSLGGSRVAGSDQRSTDSGTAFVDELKEISKSTREGMRSAVKLSKKKPIADLKNNRPSVAQVVAFGADIYKKRGQKTDRLGTLIKEISDAPYGVSLGQITEKAANAAEGSDDADLATEIVGAVKCEVIDELSREWIEADSGVVLYYMIMQQAINRPFRLVCQDLKKCTEDVVPIANGSGLSKTFEQWYSSVLEIRYTTFISYETLMESLCVLLEKYQPLLKQCDRVYAMAKEDSETHEAFDQIVKKIRTKAEEQEHSLPAPKEPRKSTRPAGKQGRGTKGGGKGGRSNSLCSSYLLTGDCKFGDKCRFKHEKLNDKQQEEVRMTILAGASRSELEAKPEPTTVGDAAPMGHAQP